MVATTNPRQRTDVLVGEEIDDHMPLWRCEGTQVIPRTVYAISRIASPLLKRTEIIRFVDPHFCLERRFLDVLEALLDEIPFSEKSKLNKSVQVEYHLAAASLSLDMGEFERRTKRIVDDMLPSGANVTFFLWSQRAGGEKLHDRFVLTELGGMLFSVGLDTGEPGETTRVARLSETSRKETWEKYQEPVAAFDLVRKFSIGG